ncbi:MAG: hypothetical protein JSU90_09375 [Nitrospiraceae bacterium]|nr:MAG: hypothetical protein JSU90_09375 [Nitrospiraceae bacterium]
MRKLYCSVLCIIALILGLTFTACQKKEEPATETGVSEKAEEKAPGYGEKAQEAAPGYGEKAQEAAPGYGEKAQEAAPGYGEKAQEAAEEAAKDK